MLEDAEGLSWEITLPLPRAQAALPRTAVAGAIHNKQASREEPRLIDNQGANFAGKRFLVMEDEPLVGLDLVAGLKKSWCGNGGTGRQVGTGAGNHWQRAFWWRTVGRELAR
jgi:hypothetical protein